MPPSAERLISSKNTPQSVGETVCPGLFTSTEIFEAAAAVSEQMANDVRRRAFMVTLARPARDLDSNRKGIRVSFNSRHECRPMLKMHKKLFAFPGTTDPGHGKAASPLPTHRPAGQRRLHLRREEDCPPNPS